MPDNVSTADADNSQSWELSLKIVGAEFEKKAGTLESRQVQLKKKREKKRRAGMGSDPGLKAQAQSKACIKKNSALN